MRRINNIAKKSYAASRVRKGATPSLVMTPTLNGIRLNSEGVEKLNISYADVLSDDHDDNVYINVWEVPSDDGNLILLGIIKGSEMKEADEAGESLSGAKLGSPQRKRAGSLTASQSGIYSALNGDVAFNTIYNIGDAYDIVENEEGEIVAVKIENIDDVDYVYYSLEFKEKIAKAERTYADGSSNKDDVNTEESTDTISDIGFVEEAVDELLG